MATFDQITDFKLMPMRYLQIHDTVTGQDHIFDHLSVDSTYEVTRPTRRDGFGADRSPGYLVSIAAIPIGTNIDEMIEAMEPTKYNRCNAFLRFEAYSDASYARKGSLWLPAPVGVDFGPIKLEQRPALQIRITRSLDSIYDYQGNKIIFIDQP